MNSLLATGIARSETVLGAFIAEADGNFATVTEKLVKSLSDKLLGWVEKLVTMLPNLVVATVVMVVFVLAARFIAIGVRRLIFRTSKNRPISDLLGGVARVTVIVLGTSIALGLLNLDKAVTSLIAGLGVVGLAAGFAFQDIASNFMAGFMMAMRRPFDVRDLVEIAGHTGTVLQIEMRATVLRTLDGLVITLPNKDVFQNAIINYTSTSERRMDLAVGVAYDSSLEQVIQITSDAGREISNRDTSREPEVLFQAFGESSIDLVLRIWLTRSDEGTYQAARSDALVRLKRSFDEAGITIPFPIRTLDFGADAVGGAQLSSRHLRDAS